MSNINDIQLSSESDELNHPNIDHKSLINYKRAEKQHKKLEKQKHLDHLIKTNGNIHEIEKLKFDLSEKLQISEERTIYGNNKENYDEDTIASHIGYLIEHANVEDFVNFMNDNRVNLETLEDNILYNLSENIKSGNNEVGLELAKISLYIKCVKRDNGISMRRIVACRDVSAFEAFDSESVMYYEEAKQAILKMYNES